AMAIRSSVSSSVPWPGPLVSSPGSSSGCRSTSAKMGPPMRSVAARIAEELAIRVSQTEAAIALLDARSTVPFIARYRKEATGGLDDTQLRALEERLHYLRDLEERRSDIRKSI